MLSRIAESLYWIGRYLERADGTARILDVHLQLLLEDPWADEDDACRSLLNVMGAPVDAARTEAVTRADVLDRFAYVDGPGSIIASLTAARENARRAREAVSTELWESLNTTRNELFRGRWPQRSPHRYFAWVRERVAAVTGFADATMSRDQVWNFMLLGRSIERADMTARLLASQDVRGIGTSGWQLVLRSCGAHEAYLRTYGAAASEDRAAEFLLMDRLFPRSVVFALLTADRCLEALSGEDAQWASRLIARDDARHMLGRARTDLEYRQLDDVLSDLATHMDHVQRICSSASDAVSRRYFPRGRALAWVRETL
ncbi:MAG: alpha-E domain-containing protein [Actinomycetota bacterium]|nr:alpha-E domain-containing protein [Actinomycetota bacterium]